MERREGVAEGTVNILVVEMGTDEVTVMIKHRKAIPHE